MTSRVLVFCSRCEYLSCLPHDSTQALSLKKLLGILVIVPDASFPEVQWASNIAS